MEQSLFLLASLVLGLFVGAGAVWLISRSHMSAVESQIKTEGQVEMARLNERFNSSQQDVSRLAVDYADMQKRGGPVWLDRMFHVLSESPCDSV
jgi:uncharacterized membrane-anchored protein YhcB (DUF1043 family)